MLTVLKRMRASIAVLMSLVGIFWLPKNIEDIGEAAGTWRRFAAMIDQNAALWALALTSAVYIVWMDIRPYVRARFGSPKPLTERQEIRAGARALIRDLDGRLQYVRQAMASNDKGALQRWRKKANYQGTHFESVILASPRELTPDEAEELSFSRLKYDELNDFLADVSAGRGYNNLAHAAHQYEQRVQKLIAALSALVALLAS